MLVHFYGSLSERLGRSVSIELSRPITTVADLRNLLVEAYPEAATEIAKPSLRACVGDEIVSDDHDIREADTVEFFPPLSGG